MSFESGAATQPARNSNRLYPIPLAASLLLNSPNILPATQAKHVQTKGSDYAVELIKIASD